MYVYLTLWTLLIIPGIIKSFSYSMTYFILNDHPEYTANQAITESRHMMNGHKMDYFLLCLSFLGWFILSILTVGIGFLWLAPYFYATSAAFYEEISKEYYKKKALLSNKTYKLSTLKNVGADSKWFRCFDICPIFGIHFRIRYRFYIEMLPSMFYHRGLFLCKNDRK